MTFENSNGLISFLKSLFTIPYSLFTITSLTFMLAVLGSRP